MSDVETSFGRSQHLWTLRTSVAFVAVLNGLSPVAADETVTWKNDVSGWYIGVDRTIDDGCYMTSRFENNISLRVGFNPAEDVLQFTVASRDWRSIEPGKLYPVEVRFGSRSPWSGDALGFAWGDGLMSLMLSVPFEGDRVTTFITELQQMQNVRVRYENRSIAFLSLRGSYAASLELIACQAAIVGGAGTGGSDPFRSGTTSPSDPFR